MAGRREEMERERQSMREAGAQVHILHRGVRPLERFDADLVGQLVQATHDLGVDF